MKKILFVIAIAILAALNMNIVFNDDNSIVDLSLTSIMALAHGESPNCSICGNNAENCNCEIGIECSHGDCWGKYCHYNSYNWACRCRANGDPYSFCV